MRCITSNIYCVLGRYRIRISLWLDSEAHNRTAHRAKYFVCIYNKEGSPMNFVRKREERECCRDSLRPF